MKKLLFSIVSLVASASAFAELSYDNAYWIIKDGKLSDNVKVVEYDPNDLGHKVPNELKDTVVNGEDVAVYKQVSKDFLDVNLKFNQENPLDLSKNYVMVFEYMIPQSNSDTAICENNKPLWMFGFASDSAGLKVKNATHADAYCFVDGKYGPVDEWVKTYKFIYSAPSLTKLYGMNFAYSREYTKGDLTEFPYIKNMAIVSIKEGKPFYFENFDAYAIGEFYMERLKFTAKNKKPFPGGVNPVITAEGADTMLVLGEYPLTLFRDFLDYKLKNQDGSGYIDCEQLHALQVETCRDSIVFPGIAIPEGTERIYSKMLIKKHKNEAGNWVDADYSVYSKADLPIKLKFNTGEIVDLANDTIKNIWTKYEGEVVVPVGAKTVDLIFGAGKAGYLADDIMLSSQKFTDVKVDQVDAESFDIVAYVNENGDIVVLNGELVAVYNMDGRVASKSDKVVVVVVKNEKGQLAAKVMLRK